MVWLRAGKLPVDCEPKEVVLLGFFEVSRLFCLAFGVGFGIEWFFMTIMTKK